MFPTLCGHATSTVASCLVVPCSLPIAECSAEGVMFSMLRSGNPWPSKFIAHVSTSVRKASAKRPQSVRKASAKRPQSPRKASAKRPQVFASVSKHSRRHHPPISVVALGRRCCVALQSCKQSRGMGPGGVVRRCCFVACEKFMSANSHWDAARWGSHLGNFICFWRVTHAK